MHQASVLFYGFPGCLYILLFFISFLDAIFALFLFVCYRWSFVHVSLIFSCPADHVSQWQPRTLLGMLLLLLLLLIHTYSAQRIVLATEETTVTQQVSHRPIKCQSRLWSQRGTKVNGSHHGDNPLLRPTGIQIATKVMRLFKHWHRPISKRFIKPPYSISRETRWTPNVVAYPRPAFSATNRKNYAPTSFDQQVQVFQGHILYRNKKN